MFKKIRIKWALKFGKLEHMCGRFLGILIILALIAVYFKIEIMAIILLILILICWIIYIISHILEKKLYPYNFRF